MIVCEPAVKVLVVYVASPPVTVPVPRTVDPSENVTVPVALLASVAVKVTGWLTGEGFADEVSVIEDGLPTVTVVAGEVAGLLFASPGVLAVMGSEPIGRFDTVIVATPPTTGAVPIVVPPLLNVTGPETPGGIVSVIVTGLPAVGFEVETDGGGNVGVDLFTV